VHNVRRRRLILRQVNTLGVVTDFFGVGTSPFLNQNLSRLVGWHESYLNSAVYAYEMGTVADWVAFFTGDWAQAIYYDRYSLLVSTLRENLLTDRFTSTIIESVIDVSETSDDDSLVVGERRRLIGDRGHAVPELTRRIIEHHVLDFLRKNKALLKGYYIPEQAVAKAAALLPGSGDKK